MLKIHILVAKAERQVVHPATTVRRRKKAVPNAKSVGRGRTVMGVKIVPKVNTATAVILLRSRAEIVSTAILLMMLIEPMRWPVAIWLVYLILSSYE